MRRRDTFVSGEYYHIFNRGVEKRELFHEKNDYIRFFNSVIDFNTCMPSWKNKIEDGPRLPRLVDIIAYCLNPNHFHFILKQKYDQGITTFMKKICTGYAMYFNKKYSRSGVLFQGRFKSVHIDSNDQLLYVSAYVNCNSEVHGISPSDSYRWCSFQEYYERKKGIATDKEIILGQFREASEYRDYAVNQIPYMRQRKELEK